MPSATDSTVPTSDRSAPPSSSPWMRSLRMLVISSGLICTGKVSLGRLGDLLSKLFQSVAHGRVQDHVPDAHHQTPEHLGVDVRGQLHGPAGLLLDALADLVD